MKTVKEASRSKTLKSRQPFPALPTFPAAAGILQFYGFKHEVKELLRLLSHTTRTYFVNHHQILRAFLVSLPELRRTNFFGKQERFDAKRCLNINETLDFMSGKQCSYFEWPKQEEIKKLLVKCKDSERQQRLDGLRVKNIMVRTDEINFLTGIKIELVNGMCSPDFRASDHGNTQTPPTVINVVNNDVSSVSVRVHKDSSGFLFYEKLIPLQNKDPGYISTLCKLSNDEKRESQHIRLCHNERLVGFHGYIYAHQYIIRLGLIIAKIDK